MNNAICHISTVHPLFDTRIFYKECKTLKKAGFSVTLIISHDKDEEVEGVTIKALPKPKNRFERIFKNTLISLKKALQAKSQVYHFHDPELIPVGIILRLLGKKVIYDVHEDCSTQMLEREWVGNMCTRKVLGVIVKLVECFGMNLFNGIIMATDDISRKNKSSKAITLRNFPVLELINNVFTLPIIKQRPIIVYAGMELARIRGIKEMVKAMEFIKGGSEFWLLGKWESEKFRLECEKQNGWRHCKYLGVKKAEEVYGYLKISDIGLATLHPAKNYLKSLPVKAFEYMACSLPMVMSDFPYWQEIFKDSTLFVNPKDPEEIAKKINLLLDNDELRKNLGKKGRELVESKYSWEAESNKLLALYERLTCS